VSNTSVALATYNGERFLREQLDSIVGQTMTPREIVVSDNGSTDSTVQILEEFASRSEVPLKLLRNEDLPDVGSNFMAAASQCSGETIAFSDQDDVWRPDKLDRCAREFSDPDVQLTIHGLLIVDEHLRPIGREAPRIRRAYVAEPLAVPKWAQYGGMSMVFRRELLDAFDWKDRPPSHRLEPLLHDEWVIGIARVLGKVAFVPETLVLYRQHATNVEGAADVRMRARVADLATAGADYYARRSAQADAWARLLASRAASAAPALADRLRQEARSYAQLARILESRAEVHDHSLGRRGRLHALGTALRSGAYGPRRAGGFGVRGLARDVAFAIAQPSLPS
jgi:glycosyltransferase involved in cell wall biosynthesis